MKLSPSISVTSDMMILSSVTHGCENIILVLIGAHKLCASPIGPSFVPARWIRSGDKPMLQKQISSQAVAVIPRSISPNDFLIVLSPHGGPENHAPPFVVSSKTPVLRPSLPLMKSSSLSPTPRIPLIFPFVVLLNPLNLLPPKISRKRKSLLTR